MAEPTVLHAGCWLMYISVFSNGDIFSDLRGHQMTFKVTLPLSALTRTAADINQKKPALTGVQRLMPATFFWLVTLIFDLLTPK